MIALVSGLAAVLFYALGTLGQSRRLSRDNDQGSAALALGRTPLLWLGFLALGTHLINVVQVVDTDVGLDFGFFKIATLFSWAMVLIVMLSSLRRPVENLFVLVFPLAVVSILCSLFLPGSARPVTQMSTGVVLHVVLGILGFSLMAIAAVQAVVVAWLNRYLKRHRYTPVLRHLPPLQTMESLLFEIIQGGFVVLLAVILTGFVFMDDMFAQHLVHKTFFTLVSTAVFGLLLWGRHRRGWRGRTALLWTLAGFGTLILAYFGSKFVLELLLNQA